MTQNSQDSDVRDFQRKLFSSYVDCLDLPASYKYIHENPVQPVVPLDTCRGGVFILGAYPSARFAAIGMERDVPVGDNCGPFSTESYFDGSTVRTVNSGHELETEYFKPLGLRRENCWITDLVRVFLFKQGHIDKYRRLSCNWPEAETRR